MSVEAICWALNLAPVPADRGGQPSSACKFVLVGLAKLAETLTLLTQWLSGRQKHATS